MTTLTAGAPAHLWVPPGRSGTYGDEVADLAASFGRPLDPSQRVAVDAVNSYGPGGRWHALESAVIIPRQNGKTGGIILASVLADLLLWPDASDRVAWTAHRLKTAREAFDDVKRMIDGSHELARRVLKVSETNGEEGVAFRNGSRLDFLARANGSGRGLGGRTVVIDEALYFTGATAGDLLPILAARDNPRVIYGSSAAKVESDYLRSLRDRGRKGGDPSLVLVEHCAPGSFDDPGCAAPSCSHALGLPGCMLDSEDYWRLSNPALVFGRILLEFLRAMRRTLPPLEFAREFLGWHEESEEGADTIPLASWESRKDDASGVAADSPRVLAFDISPDRSTAAIGGAGWRRDGDMHLSLVARDRGTSWLVPRLVDIVERHRPASIVVDGASPAATEIDALAQHGITRRTESNPHGLLVVMGTQDMARACGQAYDGLAGDAPTMWHRDEPILTAALQCAVRRDIGDGGWALGRRKSEGDISPMVAVIEAAWGLSSVPAQRASETF